MGWRVGVECWPYVESNELEHVDEVGWCDMRGRPQEIVGTMDRLGRAGTMRLTMSHACLASSSLVSNILCICYIWCIFQVE